MEINLPSDQQAHIIALAARSGRSIDDVVQEALARWAEHETDLAEFRETLDAAEASLSRGEGLEITQESMRLLADDVNRRVPERQDNRLHGGSGGSSPFGSLRESPGCGQRLSDRIDPGSFGPRPMTPG